MNEQDLALVNKHAGCFGNIIFTEVGLAAFLAERDALKHKELLQIHEVLQCIGCEHEASKDDTWTVKGVKQLAERVRKAESFRAKLGLPSPIDSETANMLWELAKKYFKMSSVVPTEVYQFSYALSSKLVGAKLYAPKEMT